MTKAFVRAADRSDPRDDFECPDPGCKSRDVTIEKGIIVTVVCSKCGRVITKMDAFIWRGRYEPPM